MSPPTCPICGKSISRDESTFAVPKLPPVYEFEDVVGRTHQRCLRNFGRRDDLRSAIARSLAAAVGADESRTITGVADSSLAIHSDTTNSSEVWNLADFARFTVIDEALPELREATGGEEIGVSPGGQQKLQVERTGILKLLGATGVTPMPSLGLGALQSISGDGNEADYADALIRVSVEPGIDISQPIVGWFKTRSSDTSIPVLLQPIAGFRPAGEPLLYLTGIDPTLDLSRLRGGETLFIRVDEQTEFRATITGTSGYFPEPDLVDDALDSGRAVRHAS
jgi:hypothetical protein